MRQYHLVLLLLGLTVLVKSFSPHPLLLFATPCNRLITMTFLRNDIDIDDDDDDDDDADTRLRGIPQLPATISSTTSCSTASNTTSTTTTISASPVVGPKLQLQYTCQICDTRNVHQVSRIAYRQGVVIARCRGCSNQHLIADHHHLGAFSNTNTTSSSGNVATKQTNTKGDDETDNINPIIVKDIETYLQQQGKSVHRVSQQVFDLEQVWSVDTSSGSLMGENGERNME